MTELKQKKETPSNGFRKTIRKVSEFFRMLSGNGKDQTPKVDLKRMAMRAGFANINLDKVNGYKIMHVIKPLHFGHIRNNVTDEMDPYVLHPLVLYTEPKDSGMDILILTDASDISTAKVFRRQFNDLLKELDIGKEKPTFVGEQVMELLEGYKKEVEKGEMTGRIIAKGMKQIEETEIN
jgi:hypothetical protein